MCGLCDKKPVIVLTLLALLLGVWDSPACADDWVNPLEYKGKLDSPLVEVTPFVFKDKFYLLENWQKQWENPGDTDGSHFTRDEVRIRDMAGNRIVSIPFTGHGLGMALVHDDRVYVFAGDWGTEKKWQITKISMVSSDDLVNWSKPVVVLEAQPHEKFFNVSVCRGADRFVLLIESNDPAWPSFTFKYFESDDLVQWEPIADALYGEEKYVGGPALYYEGDYFYTLYLQALGDRFYQTRVTRSKDLIHWQDAPVTRPVATFDPENRVHRLRPPEIRERNASDVELCEWQGRTIVYYTGGDQQYAGDLQWADFEGSPQEFLESFYIELDDVHPSENQLRYQENQVGCFVHFGPASYLDKNGGDYLTVPAADLFDPTALDTDQWMRAAKSIGAKHIILTAKHHNGYCLWPTETTDYSVQQSPWKNGAGDVVRMFVDSARKHGISPGLYLSSGDTHFGCTSTPDPLGERKLVGDVEAYFPVFMNQLTELLSNYGDLEVVWFDGAYNPFMPDVIDETGAPTGGIYADRISELVRRLQPKAVIMGGGDADVRWSGSEQGRAPYPLWNEVSLGEGRENWLPEYAEGWFIPESNIHTRPHWFWAPGTDESLKTPEEMMEAYDSSVALGSNLLVNLTPDMRGLLSDAEVAMLKTFGANLYDRFAEPKGKVSSQNRWEEGNALVLDFGQPTNVDHVKIKEELDRGQRVRQYQIESWQDDAWVVISKGTSIGRKRIHNIDAIETRALRLKVLDTAPLPGIRAFAAY